MLRAQITERVGLGWAPRAQGVGEIASVPVEVLKAFSRRRAEIVEELERLGTLWRARAEELGFGLRELEALLERGPLPEPRIEQPLLFAELRSPIGMTAQGSTFTRRDLLQVLAERVGPERTGHRGRPAADGRRVLGIG